MKGDDVYLRLQFVITYFVRMFPGPKAPRTNINMPKCKVVSVCEVFEENVPSPGTAPQMCAFSVDGELLGYEPSTCAVGWEFLVGRGVSWFSLLCCLRGE